MSSVVLLLPAGFHIPLITSFDLSLEAVMNDSPVACARSKPSSSSVAVNGSVAPSALKVSTAFAPTAHVSPVFVTLAPSAATVVTASRTANAAASLALTVNVNGLPHSTVVSAVVGGVMYGAFLMTSL